MRPDAGDGYESFELALEEQREEGAGYEVCAAEVGVHY